MLKGYTYRIYPNDTQTKQIEQTIGCCRLVYNLALEVKTTAYKNAGVNLSAFDLCYQLAEMKLDYPWMNEVDSQALQASVKKVDAAFKGLFQGKGYPKFKSKHGAQSFQCPNNTRRIDFKKGLLTIPKISNIPIIISQSFVGKIKTVTIKRVPSGKYFASILVEDETVIPVKQPIEESKTIGIDLGIKDFSILSDGTKIDNPKYLRNNLKRIKCLQKRVSRKKKGSKKRKKAVKKLAIQHEKVANMRKDFLQKVTTKLVRDSQATTFCIEDLALKNMVKNHCLAQAISDVGWGEFVRQMKYKCEWYGKNLVQIGRFEPSSKTCSNCGAINETLTLQHREWTCANCFATHDRDVNAALNIKETGLRYSGLGKSGEAVELLPTGRVKKRQSVN